MPNTMSRRFPLEKAGTIKIRIAQMVYKYCSISCYDVVMVSIMIVPLSIPELRQSPHRLL